MAIGGANYPLSKKSHGLEHLRQHAHLRPRAKVHAAAMRIRHAMAFATHKFFNDNGFLYIHTPIVTCADCEGAGEQFGITTMLGTDPHKTDVKVPYVEEPKKKEGAEKEGGNEKGGEDGGKTRCIWCRPFPPVTNSTQNNCFAVLYAQGDSPTRPRRRPPRRPQLWLRRPPWRPRREGSQLMTRFLLVL